jgi:hypothetical protein
VERSNDVQVANYRLYRDGQLRATVGGATLSYADTTTTRGTTYTYQVSAVDEASRASTLSASVSITP